MIRRAEHSAEKRFTLVSRSLAQNKSLSFQARGFMVFVLSKPAKWEATDANIQREGGIGKKALASILAELKDAGYLRRTQERKRDGTIHYVTVIFEEPVINAGSTVTPKGTTVTVTPFPPTDNGTTDNKSTCARAGSSVDLTERRDKRKRSYKPPSEPTFLIAEVRDSSVIDGDGSLRKGLRQMFPLLDFDSYYQKWWGAKFQKGGIARRAHAPATLSEYRVSVETYFRNCADGTQNGNGHKKPEQEYTGPVKSTPNPKAENCPDCRGMGNVRFEIDGIWYAKPCKHERSGVVAA